MKLSEKIGRLFKLTVFSEPHKISFKQAEDNFQNRFQGEFKLTPYFWIFFSQSDSFKTFFFFFRMIPITCFFSQKVSLWFTSQYTSVVFYSSKFGRGGMCIWHTINSPWILWNFRNLCMQRKNMVNSLKVVQIWPRMLVIYYSRSTGM